MKRKAWVIVLLFLAVPLSYGELVVRLEPEKIQEGGTFEMTVQFLGSKPKRTPDFRFLEKDFQIIKTTQSERTVSLDKKPRPAFIWTLELKPRHTGRIRIPSFRVGGFQSRHRHVEVAAVGQHASLVTGKSKTLILEAAVSRKNPYIQQEVELTVSLYSVGLLNYIDYTEPVLVDSIVKALPEEKPDVVKKNNRKFYLYEKHYVIYPGRSGRMRIPGLVVTVPVSSLKPGDSQGKRISIKTRDIVLDVKTPAVKSPYWLPARAVQIDDQPQAGVLQQGEPITRTIVLQAEGLTAAQLPDLGMPRSEKYTMYVDQPQLKDVMLNGSNIGKKTIKIALVPKVSGQLELPPIKLLWWDVAADKQRTAFSGARRFQVLAADIVTTPPAAAAVDTLVDAAIDTQGLPRSESNLLVYLALLISTAGWAMTTWLWLRTRAHVQRHDKTAVKEITVKNLKAAIKTVQLASKVRRPQSARDALLNWAGHQWKDDPPKTLLGMAKRIDDNLLSRQIVMLDESLYNKRAWDGEPLIEALQKYRGADRRELPKKIPSGLPQLNPGS